MLMGNKAIAPYGHDTAGAHLSRAAPGASPLWCGHEVERAPEPLDWAPCRSKIAFRLSRGRNVRLNTLVRLRWLAVIGQTTAVLVVYLGLDFELPIWACLAVIALAAWLNVALRLRFRMTQRVEPERAAWLLAFDIAELAILLFLTGGSRTRSRSCFWGPCSCRRPRCRRG